MAIAAGIFPVSSTLPQTTPAANPPTFESDILPIVTANCQQCHGPKLQMKELNLTTSQGIQHGRESGPGVVPGQSEESSLYKIVHEGKMPPCKKNQLSEKDVATIAAWIQGGL